MSDQIVLKLERPRAEQLYKLLEGYAVFRQEFLDLARSIASPSVADPVVNPQSHPTFRPVKAIEEKLTPKPPKPEVVVVESSEGDFEPKKSRVR
jgi:hypothetical protein